MCTCRWTDAFSETKTWETSTGVFTACCNFNNITAVAAMAWRPTILINSTKAVEIQQSFCVKPSAVVQKRNHLKQPASWYSIQYKALRIDLKSYCKKVITSIFFWCKKANTTSKLCDFKPFRQDLGKYWFWRLFCFVFGHSVSKSRCGRNLKLHRLQTILWLTAFHYGRVWSIPTDIHSLTQKINKISFLVEMAQWYCGNMQTLLCIMTKSAISVGWSKHKRPKEDVASAMWKMFKSVPKPIKLVFVSQKAYFQQRHNSWIAESVLNVVKRWKRFQTWNLSISLL